MHLLHHPLRPLVAGTVLLLASACGGGGGSGPADGTPPSILAATVRVAGVAPAAGDTLFLTFSEPVALTGAILDDADLSVVGGSLGAVAAAPAAASSRVVALTLGAGTSITPGTTRLAFADGNDAVDDLAGNAGKDGALRTITLGDGTPPVLGSLTVSGVTGDLNGNGAAGGTLQTFPNGFTIDLTFADVGGVDPARTMISASENVGVDGGQRWAGSELADALVVSATAVTASYTVPANVSFRTRDLTLTVWVVDNSGEVSAPRAFSFRCAGRTDLIRPFENGQTWYLDLGLDIEGFTAQTAGGAVSSVRIDAGANGRPDLEDLFRIVGLFSATNSATNATVRQRFRDRLMAELQVLVSGSPIAFTYTAPGSFPPGTYVVAYGASSFSRMCIRGAADTVPTGVLGAALYDTNNETQEDNCRSDGSRLGVFVHTLVHYGYLGGPTTLFRQTYDPLTPSIGNTPIGDDAQDAGRLAGSVNDGRTTTIDNAIARFARMIAIVTAHECGHSMGLVANGPMPAGLYGNDPVHFPLSGAQPPSNADGHIENAFPAGSQNVMSPALSFTAAQSPLTGFNTLNLAYLRERAIYQNQ